MVDKGVSKEGKKFCRRHRRSRDENLENSLDEVDLQEKGFLLSPHTAQTDYWCSRPSRGGVSGTGCASLTCDPHFVTYSQFLIKI